VLRHSPSHRSGHPINLAAIDAYGASARSGWCSSPASPSSRCCNQPSGPIRPSQAWWIAHGEWAGYPRFAPPWQALAQRWEAACPPQRLPGFDLTEVTDERAGCMKSLKTELARCSKAGRWPGGQSRRAGGGQPVSTTTGSAACPPLWWGATPSAAANADGLPRAQVRATTFSYDLQLSLDTSFTFMRQTDFALDPAAGQLQRSGFRRFWRRTNRRIAAWRRAFRKDSGPIAWAATSSTTRHHSARLSPPPSGGRVGQEDIARPLARGVYQLHRLNVLTLQTGPPVGLQRKTSVRGGLGCSQRLQFSAELTLAATQPRQSQLRVACGTRRSAAPATVQIGYGAEAVGPRRDRILTYSRRSMWPAPRLSRAAARWWENPASRSQCPLASVVTGNGQLRLGFPRQACWGINNHLRDDTIRVDGRLTTIQSWMVGLRLERCLL